MYSSPKALALLILSVLLLVGAAVLSAWRKRHSNPRVKHLSRSWASVSFWLGLIGLFLVVARVEEIQFLAMRIWWVLWVVAAVLYVFFQIRHFRAQYYQVLPADTSTDPRAAYLPKRKRR